MIVVDRSSFIPVACAPARWRRTRDDGSLGSPDATMPFNPQVEATDSPFPTVPAEGATLELIAERIHVGVLQALGVVLAVTDDECIRTGLLADVDAGALVRIGLDGIIEEQPIPVQTQIFGVFDRCVSPERYAGAGSGARDRGCRRGRSLVRLRDDAGDARVCRHVPRRGGRNGRVGPGRDVARCHREDLRRM